MALNDDSSVIDQAKECPPRTPKIKEDTWKLLHAMETKQSDINHGLTLMWTDVYGKGGVTEKVHGLSNIVVKSMAYPKSSAQTC